MAQGAAMSKAASIDFTSWLDSCLAESGYNLRADVFRHGPEIGLRLTHYIDGETLVVRMAEWGPDEQLSVMRDLVRLAISGTHPRAYFARLAKVVSARWERGYGLGG